MVSNVSKKMGESMEPGRGKKIRRATIFSKKRGSSKKQNSGKRGKIVTRKGALPYARVVIQ